MRLLRTENVGPITFHRLLNRYGTATKALEALPHLTTRGGKAKPLTPPPLSQAEKEFESLKKFGATIICSAEDHYPDALRSVEDAPPIITVLGNAKLLSSPCVGIVGARNASLNGKKFAGLLAQDLGRAGQTIVSGLARGIDTSAHQGSLQTGTIAVVAGGIDVIYPPENAALYQHIREGGVIVAESPFGQEPFAQSFPRRNRIISGLSRGVVVVEASLRSGSLITARMAAEQGRDVFAVPGHPLDPRAAGTNALIRDGAILVREAMDVLSDLGKFSANGLRDIDAYAYDPDGALFEESENLGGTAHDLIDLSGDLSSEILGHLSSAPVSIDDLIRACGGYTAAVSGNLLMLELAGQVQRLPGNRVVRVA